MQQRRRLIIQGISIFVLFQALNALLLVWHGSAVPRRDLLASMIGFLGLMAAVLVLPTPEKVKLDRTKRFRTLFQMISLCEVLGTVVAPWYFIAREAKNDSSSNAGAAGYLLAPHLFVFQEQIALDCIILMQSTQRPLLMFRYTCIANAYRGLAIATWVGRTLQYTDGMTTTSPDSLPLLILPAIATLLWFCSNAFVIFLWYPCLKPIVGDESKKQQ